MLKTNANTSKPEPPKSATPKPVGDRVSVRGKLALLGWKSTGAWARAHGYGDCMVSACVKTWGMRTDRQPHGGISKALMADLRRTLEMGVRPSDLNHGSGD